MNSYNKKYIFSTIFLLYFIVFAISPLSYSYTARKMARNFSAPDKVFCLSKGIDIFFWELICKKLVSKNDISHSDSPATIFFRKARAILSEDITTKIVHFEDVSVAKSYVAPVAYPLSKLAILFDGQDPLQKHRPLLSGPSPPSA
jgi:hypothetical protein